MLNGSTLRLVLLVSLGHALVHVFEHSFASVEQLVVADSAFGIASELRRQTSGELGSTLRFPFGLCAMLAGWAADHYGAKRLLLVYLSGAALAAVLACWSPNLAAMFGAMFVLGMFASIYHPAGVSLIAHHTTPENRSLALGYHGILGAAGTAAGPFLAGAVLATGATWRQYYLGLTVPAILLALVFRWNLSDHDGAVRIDPGVDQEPHREDTAQWGGYVTLLFVSSLAGIVYAGILNFLPRYLDQSGLNLGIPRESLRNYLTGGVLALGAIGQYGAGRMARPRTLELLMAVSFFATAPFIFWMGWAKGPARLLATGGFTILFFMHQPLVNSLIAKYVPRRRRSLCFGLSFSVGFGIGSIGPTVSGLAPNDLVNFAVLGTLLAIAATVCLVLWWRYGDPWEPSRTAPAADG
ncbi:MAG: MFS transporter [Thermoguttaceae bacterium]